MAGFITAAQAVNQILRKFPGSNIEFLAVDAYSLMVQIGPRKYVVEFKDAFLVNEFKLLPNFDVQRESNQFSDWVHGVLNNYARNDAGVLSPVAEVGRGSN